MSPPSPSFFHHTFPHLQTIPTQIKALLASCWNPDPDARPEFEEIVDALEAIRLDLQPTVTREVSNDAACCCCTVQ